MNRRLRLLIGIGSFCLCLPVFAQLPYQNPDLSPEKRANDLLNRLMKEDLEWFDTNTNTMRPIEGEYELLYGGSSDMNSLKSVTITVK